MCVRACLRFGRKARVCVSLHLLKLHLVGLFKAHHLKVHKKGTSQEMLPPLIITCASSPNRWNCESDSLSPCPLVNTPAGRDRRLYKHEQGLENEYDCHPPVTRLSPACHYLFLQRLHGAAIETQILFPCYPSSRHEVIKCVEIRKLSQINF